MSFTKLENAMKYWTTIEYWSDYGKLTAKPEWKLAIITCMDCRIISKSLGVTDPGKMVIIRNAGALITNDSLRSVLVAIYELDVQCIAIIGHTQCGGQMNGQQMNELLNKIAATTNLAPQQVLRHLGASTPESAFLGFTDVVKQVRASVETLRRLPLIPKAIEIRGYIYDTKSGKFHRVLPDSTKPV